MTARTRRDPLVVALAVVYANLAALIVNVAAIAAVKAGAKVPLPAVIAIDLVVWPIVFTVTRRRFASW